MKDPGSIPGYRLAAPDERAAVASLERVLGAQGAVVWADARQRAGIDPGIPLGWMELKRVVMAVMALGGAASVCAKSMNVRILTYEMLQKKNTAGGKKVAA